MKDSSTMNYCQITVALLEPEGNIFEIRRNSGGGKLRMA